MRIPAILCLAFLAACGAQMAAGAADQNINLGSSGNATMRMVGSEGAHIDSITVSNVDQLFRILPTIYDSIGIAVTDLNPGQTFLGNGQLKIRRQLGKTLLSRFLDCGNAQGDPSAETYELTLSIRTALQARPAGGVYITTQLEGYGRPIAFAGEYVRCSSKGELERTIFASLKAKAH